VLYSSGVVHLYVVFSSLLYLMFI